MGNVLYIGMKVKDHGGYTVIHYRNIDLLSQFFGEVSIVELESDVSGSIFSKLLNGWKGNYFRLTNAFIRNVLQKIETLNPQLVFFGNSLSTYLIIHIKRKYPNLPIISFFHNCEYSYFKEQYKAEKWSLLNLMHIIFAYRSERIAIKYSHYIWGLNKRDSDDLEQIYKRSLDLILATSFIDKAKQFLFHEPEECLNLLFVGSSLYANVQGIIYFVQNVMPFVKVKLYIVGNGLENYKDILSVSNVSVVGRVEDLSLWYKKSDIVVSPIFFGSGMKTKTAEAMMYSKPIIASEEAFKGYNIESDRIGAVCNEAKEFIDAINYFDRNRELLKDCALYSREMFVSFYTFEKSVHLVEHFFEKNRVYGS